MSGYQPDEAMSDELRVRRQIRCAHHGHTFNAGVCTNCELTILPPTPAVERAGRR